ncbi:MAG: hypothetical protein V2I27_06135 [Erythrobacter sp.]|jgi:fluoroquinolone transport system permease protein|nr:hypothetical protein [Erythrobacter sp.]
MAAASKDKFPAVRKVLMGEFAAIARDPALVSVVAMSAAPAFLFQIFSREFDGLFLDQLGIAQGTRVVAGFVGSLPGLLIGWVFAMRFLEDRDEGLEPVIAASEFGIWRFTLLRLFLAAMLAFALSAATAVSMEASGGIVIAVVAICASLQALLVASLLPSFAENRVEGLAYSKLISPFALAAVAALVDTNLRLLAAPLPTFHMGQLLSRNSEPGQFALAAALLVNLVWALVAVMIFRRRIGMANGRTGDHRLTRAQGARDDG